MGNQEGEISFISFSSVKIKKGVEEVFSKDPTPHKPIPSFFLREH
jgi:hypothetical protein